MKLIEVQIKEEAKSKFDDFSTKLDSMWNHPARYKYQNWWQNPDGTITPVGGSAYIRPDKNGEFEYCGNQCLVIGEIDKSRYMEADRFEAIAE